jgi:lysophospholipase L1-like esterase
VRFLALGDSYTIGEQVDAAARWPVQLARALRARQLDVGEPEIVARTGWTTDELVAGILAASPAGPYDLVSLLIGVNNQYRGRGAENYRAEFTTLLADAAGFAGGAAPRVIVLSIPDWGVTPFAAGRDRAKIAREIDEFNAIAHDESLAAGAAWVDVTPASREMRADWLAPDGLHPSGAQYARWSALALDAAVAALRYISATHPPTRFQ